MKEKEALKEIEKCINDLQKAQTNTVETNPEEFGSIESRGIAATIQLYQAKQSETDKKDQQIKKMEETRKKNLETIKAEKEKVKQLEERPRGKQQVMKP